MRFEVIRGALGLNSCVGVSPYLLRPGRPSAGRYGFPHVGGCSVCGVGGDCGTSPRVARQSPAGSACAPSVASVLGLGIGAGIPPARLRAQSYPPVAGGLFAVTQWRRPADWRWWPALISGLGQVAAFQPHRRRHLRLGMPDYLSRPTGRSTMSASACACTNTHAPGMGNNAQLASAAGRMRLDAQKAKNPPKRVAVETPIRPLLPRLAGIRRQGRRADSVAGTHRGNRRR